MEAKMADEAKHTQELREALTAMRDAAMYLAAAMESKHPGLRASASAKFGDALSLTNAALAKAVQP